MLSPIVISYEDGRIHIADQLFSTLNGEAWYGDSVQEILEGVTPEQALSHPIPSADFIWELVHHVEAWCRFAYGAVQGIAIPGWPDMPQELDFRLLSTRTIRLGNKRYGRCLRTT